MSGKEALERNLMRRVNIGDIPKRTAAKYPDKESMVWQDKRITFEELNANARRCANSFLEMGVKKGDHVAFITHSCLQYIFSWLGLVKIGAIVNPLNFTLKGSDMEYIMNHAEPVAFSWRIPLSPGGGGQG